MRGIYMRNAKNNDLKNINNRSKNSNSKNKKTGNDFDERMAGPEQPDSYMEMTDSGSLGHLYLRLSTYVP